MQRHRHLDFEPWHAALIGNQFGNRTVSDFDSLSEGRGEGKRVALPIEIAN